MTNKELRGYASQMQARADRVYYALLLVAAITLGFCAVATWLLMFGEAIGG